MPPPSFPKTEISRAIAPEGVEAIQFDSPFSFKTTAVRDAAYTALTSSSPSLNYNVATLSEIPNAGAAFTAIPTLGVIALGQVVLLADDTLWRLIDALGDASVSGTRVVPDDYDVDDNDVAWVFVDIEINFANLEGLQVNATDSIYIMSESNITLDAEEIHLLATTLTFNGVSVLTATGDGSGLTNIDHSQVGGVCSVARGGTGVANSHTITIGGTVILSGAYSFTGTLTGATTVTFPTSGTLATRAGTETFTGKTISGASNTLTVRLASDVTGTLPIENGGTGVTSKPSFAAYCSSTTTLTTGGATKVNFATEDFDIASNYDTTLSRFTAPIAGKYRFNTTIIVNGTLGSNAEVYFAKNGTKQKSVYYNVADPATTKTLGGVTVLSLAANDYVEVFAFNDSGSSRTALNYQAYTQFAGEFITS